MITREYSNLINDIDQVKALKQTEEFYPENGVYDSVLNTYKMREFFSDNVSFNEEVIDKVLRRTENDYLNSLCIYITILR